jgi:3-hydroxypropionyl-CoA synthetase (ADP-forming)
MKLAWLNFLESICFLEENNIVCHETFIINKKDQLKKHIDFPYVLKISSDLLHKTEVNAVKTDLFSLKDLEKAFLDLNTVLIKNKIDGTICLQKQIKGIEVIVGITNDSQFGKVLLFGQGGIFAEKNKDNSMKILPITKKDTKDLLEKTIVGKIISKGYRNKKYPKEKLEKLFLDLSKLAIQKDIKELDLNPIIITEKEIYIVDARIKV